MFWRQWVRICFPEKKLWRQIWLIAELKVAYILQKIWFFFFLAELRWTKNFPFTGIKNQLRGVKKKNAKICISICFFCFFVFVCLFTFFYLHCIQSGKFENRSKKKDFYPSSFILLVDAVRNDLRTICTQLISTLRLIFESSFYVLIARISLLVADKLGNKLSSLQIFDMIKLHFATIFWNWIFPF